MWVLPTPTGPCRITDSPACSQRSAARSRICAAGSLGFGGEVEPLQGGGAQRADQGVVVHDRRAGRRRGRAHAEPSPGRGVAGRAVAGRAVGVGMRSGCWAAIRVNRSALRARTRPVRLRCRGWGRGSTMSRGPGGDRCTTFVITTAPGAPDPRVRNAAYPMTPRRRWLRPTASIRRNIPITPSRSAPPGSSWAGWSSSSSPTGGAGPSSMTGTGRTAATSARSATSAATSSRHDDGSTSPASPGLSPAASARARPTAVPPLGRGPVQRAAVAAHRRAGGGPVGLVVTPLATPHPLLIRPRGGRWRAPR